MDSSFVPLTRLSARVTRSTIPGANATRTTYISNVNLYLRRHNDNDYECDVQPLLHFPAPPLPFHQNPTVTPYPTLGVIMGKCVRPFRFSTFPTQTKDTRSTSNQRCDNREIPAMIACFVGDLKFGVPPFNNLHQVSGATF